MARRSVPRSFRIANAATALVFLIGAGLYLRSWLGMRALEGYEADPTAPIFTGMARFNELWELSRMGLWIMIAAGAAALLTALVAAFVLRTPKV